MLARLTPNINSSYILGTRWKCQYKTMKYFILARVRLFFFVNKVCAGVGKSVDFLEQI
jgi:hypothetical protein